MLFFKYYRPNIYFEKAIRYNELYFCMNGELNDPHDLKATYCFEDSPELWSKLLMLSPFSDFLNIRNYIDPGSEKLVECLNNIFKNSAFDSIEESLNDVLASKKELLIEIFSEHQIEYDPSSKMEISTKNLTKRQISEMCISLLTELLSRATNHRFYSASFSKAALEPMMWAHYAEGFKGVVVIYDELQANIMGIRDHPQSPKLMPAELHEVKYIDGEKIIPILECATSGKEKAHQALLRKNSFWEYEDELRLLVEEKIDSRLMSISQKNIKNNRERIFYHDPSSIVGIIFGPRCTEDYKDKIEHIIRDNRFYSDKRSFFSFSTSLNHGGKVVIKKGDRCISIDRNGLKQPIEGEGLNDLLRRMSLSTPVA